MIALGRQICRLGILANCKSVKAHVVDNIEVPGIRFTCLNCHGRSDMGGDESKTFTLAINPSALFAPRNSMYLERSAYDDESLTACIRQGEPPEGFIKGRGVPSFMATNTMPGKVENTDKVKSG